jgi:hypothetical protein
MVMGSTFEHIGGSARSGEIEPRWRTIMKRLLIVLTSAFALTIGWVATASADPAVHNPVLTCEGGTSFTGEYVEPPKAGGASNQFKIVPGTGTGAAAEATAFNYHAFFVTDATGEVVFSAGNPDANVGRHHQLFTCSTPDTKFPGAGFTLHRIGFFIPAR